MLKYVKNKKDIYYDIKFSFGDTHFGGEDFDYILMKKCLENIGENNFNKKLQCNIRLKRACEIAKIKLSNCESTNIILEEYSKDVNINFPLTRTNFEKYSEPIFKKFEQILKTFLKDCGQKEKDISEVVLIGGSTYIPKVQEIIKKVFRFSQIKNDLDPNETVAKGAAIQAAMLSNLPSVKNMCLLDVTNLSLGVNMLGNKMSKIIKRSTPIPEEICQIYTTVADNQTEALIEIFEGEDEITTNNLKLDDFTISNLPKMKKGEAKIKINIFINNDSILKVTAYDMQNENNKNELEIKRPKGLRDKIEGLKLKIKQIKEYDLDQYIKIKDLIISSEEEISQTKEKGQLKEIKSKIINILGEFVVKIIYEIEKEKIAICYIKYYFMKIMKYLDENKEDKISDNFNKNLNLILDEIQYINTNLIFEIIEIFVDNKNLYSKCIIQLLDRYYEKIANDFYHVNNTLKKEPNNYQKILAELEALKKIIELSKRFFEIGVEKDSKRAFISVKDKINDFKIKIDVKELIIKNLQKSIDFSKIKEKEKIEKLYNEYKDCKTNDIKDFIELERIITNSNKAINQEDKKAENFLEIFEKLKDDDFQKFMLIFDKFEGEQDNLTEIYEKIDDKKERYQFLLKLCAKYNNLSNNITPCKKKDAIDKIHVYLNHLKQKCEQNLPLFNEEY